MTLYNNPDEDTYSRTGYRARYDCIFNVVNETDVYCFVMPQKLGFSRYGMACYGGLDIYDPIDKKFKTNEESVIQILSAFDKLYENSESRTREKTYAKAVVSKKADNYLGYYNVFKRLICAIDKDRNNKTNEEDSLIEFYNRYSNVNDLAPLINALRTYLSYSKVAGTDDVYYNISKEIRNEDIQNTVNYYDNQKKRKKNAIASQLYDKYPNYHVLNDIYINNPVPSIFQDAEVWSQFRYGITYNEDKDDTIDHPNDVKKDKNKIRKVRKYVNSWSNEERSRYYELKSQNKRLKQSKKKKGITEQEKADIDIQISSNNQEMNNLVSTYNVYFYGTFWESGCGLTSASIVLSYLSDKQITPIDIRDRLEMSVNEEDYRPGSSGTSHATIKNIAELYGYQCANPTVYEAPPTNQREEDDEKAERELRNNEKTANIVKELLRGNPVIAICHNGEFTAGGHYIVIAGIETDQIDDLKRKKGIATISDAEEKEKKWNETINNLTYNELSNLRIYVMDPRYKHQAHPSSGKQATITHAWDINTFSYGGAGNPEKFWIYKKDNDNIDLGTGVNETDLFNFNGTKYPDDYIEYFDPQGPDDTDEFCNRDGSVKAVGSFGKLDGQKWR